MVLEVREGTLLWAGGLETSALALDSESLLFRWVSGVLRSLSRPGVLGGRSSGRRED